VYQGRGCQSRNPILPAGGVTILFSVSGFGELPGVCRGWPLDKLITIVADKIAGRAFETSIVPSSAKKGRLLTSWETAERQRSRKGSPQTGTCEQPTRRDSVLGVYRRFLEIGGPRL